MRISILCVLIAFFGHMMQSLAQEKTTSQMPVPVFQLDFDEAPEPDLQRSALSYGEAIPAYCKGILGRALDLSARAALRRPIIIDQKEAGFNGGETFSLQIWIKTQPGAVLGMPVMGNKRSDQQNQRGWLINSQNTGAWAINFSDSTSVYDYAPTDKQRINDGQWHQIVWVMDVPGSKAYMYFDGRNRAIYNVKGLGQLTSGNPIVVGGTDEYGEYGSNYQWKSFNGMIDEVKIWDCAISSAEVFDLYSAFKTTEMETETAFDQLKVLTWNIWHGGRRTGEIVGVQRTIDMISSAGIDVVCMQETYGSGAIIADSLNFYFYLISSNLSIMSRYPIEEVYDIYKPFNCGSARIRLSDDQELMVFCIWLHYLPDYTRHVREKSHTVQQLIEDEGKTRHKEIVEILKEAHPFLEQSEKVPVLMCGDFNSGSHLDWIERTQELHNGYIVKWPVSAEMNKAGMTDSYRISHPDPLLYPGITWTPRASTNNFADGSLDRIDYIYFKGSDLEVIKCEVLNYHPIQFPSDHSGVITTFKLKNW